MSGSCKKGYSDAERHSVGTENLGGYLNLVGVYLTDCIYILTLLYLVVLSNVFEMIY